MIDGHKEITDISTNLSTSNDLFAFAINYNTGAAPLYNGNISETQWKSKTDNMMRSYAYEYDDLNRLKMASYGGEFSLAGPTSYIGNYTEGPIIYDKNGNIKTLHRYKVKAGGGYDKIDMLSYTYFPYSNQLKG